MECSQLATRKEPIRKIASNVISFSTLLECTLFTPKMTLHQDTPSYIYTYT